MPKNFKNIAVGVAVLLAVAMFNQWENHSAADATQQATSELNQSHTQQSNHQPLPQVQTDSVHSTSSTAHLNELQSDDTDKIQQAFHQQHNDVQVKASGKVKAILSDDHQGSRHQRFLLALSTGQTILIAHNIDLAPRVPHLEKGDTVEFYGVYEYNSQGGVVHWTHHDPQGKHIGGWLKHQNQHYE